LKEQLVEKKPAFAILNCNGVGYLLHISLHTYSLLPDVAGGKVVECRLLTHLIVREDAFMLYGFHNENERFYSGNLITVSGIGANTARLIFSSLNARRDP
jgi:holliday junction DNA helicase RuvA